MRRSAVAAAASRLLVAAAAAAALAAVSADRHHPELSRAAAAALAAVSADRHHPELSRAAAAAALAAVSADRHHPELSRAAAAAALAAVSADRHHPELSRAAAAAALAAVSADRHHPELSRAAAAAALAAVSADRHHPELSRAAAAAALAAVSADRHHPELSRAAAAAALAAVSADRHHPELSRAAAAAALAAVSADRHHPELSRAAAAAALAAVSADRHHPELSRAAAATAAGARVPHAAENTAHFWYSEAYAGIAERERRGAGAGAAASAARNVVMFLGDGMSVPTLAAARTLLGQRRNRTGEEAQLAFEAFPTVGMVKTYCVDEQVADSACSATAYLCGAKANYGTLGVTGAVARRDCAASLAADARLSSIAQWALDDGRDVGIVTTTRVTHASPAGAYARSANRGWENDAAVRDDGHDAARCADIAHQLVRAQPGARFKVILGGGRREFRPNSTRDEEGTLGRRADDRDLIQEWCDDKAARNLSHAYVWHAAELRALAADPPEYLLGLFEGTHLRYHLEGDPASEPTLTELTEVAIRALSRNERGFFLFVEGGRIDHAHHDNYPHLALDETIELSAAVQRATELLAEEDSLVVVTSDHSHAMAFNGYARRGGDILGPSGQRGRDGVPYMTLSYTNGPGARAHPEGHRPDVTQDDDFRELRWRTHAEVPLDSETHGGDDVSVFAWGAAHGMFSGLYEQSQLPHLMAYAACLGPGPQAPACRAASVSAAGTMHSNAMNALTLLCIAITAIDRQ